MNYIDYCIREDVETVHDCYTEVTTEGIDIYCNYIWCNFVEKNVEIEDIDGIISAHLEYYA